MQINCIKCNWNGTFGDYHEHFLMHENITCPHCLSKFASDDLLNEHLNEKNGNCEVQPMDCFYSNIGCHVNFQYNRKTLNDHNYNNVANHLFLLYNDIDPRLRKLEKNFHTLDTLIKNSYNIQESSISTPEHASNDKEIEKKVKKSVKNKNKLEKKNQECCHNLMENHEIKQKMLNLEDNLKNLDVDLRKYVKGTEKINKSVDDFNENENKLKNEIENLKKSLTFAQSAIMCLEERLIFQERASYCGSLIWKISNVAEKIREARSGGQQSIYSPPFYTHQNGYKMSGRVYFNGDGQGRNTHFSLFFVIMRGEYDALLRWPFRQKVTFMLLDQSLTKTKENIVDAFRPDPYSNSFKKPISQINIASGIPLFCPLSKLTSPENEYIKDDCMFIKIMVDSRDLMDI